MTAFLRFASSVTALAAFVFIIIAAWTGVATLRSVCVAVAVIAASEIVYWGVKAAEEDQETP